MATRQKVIDLKQHRMAAVKPGLIETMQKGLDVLLPPQCPVSGDIVDRHGAFSPAVWRKLNFIAAPYCPRCGVPFQIDQGEAILCGDCASPEKKRRHGKPALIHAHGLDHVRAALTYDEASSALVMGIKYADRLEYVKTLAQLMAVAGQDIFGVDPVIVPVPLHRKRLWFRRYNQSALLAAALAELIGGQVVLNGLCRTRATRPQVGMTAKQRALNVRGVFGVTEAAKPALLGKDVILIDDVLTTGATLMSCARALKQEDAATVNGLVVARVVHNGIGAI